MTRALDEIRVALRDPRTAGSWFGENPPQLDGKLRFSLVTALLRRTTAFSQVTDEALAIARMTSAYTVDFDWGPLLARAFPQPLTAPGGLSRTQRQFLTAIADNDGCWGSVANPHTWLRKAGLPTRRDDLRTVVAASTDDSIQARRRRAFPKR
jgi:hypothetical protein